MADDQFAARESAYNDNLGQTVGRFCTAIVEADSAAKDAYVLRMLELLKQPNADFEASTTIIGQKQPLTTDISVPVIAIAQANPIAINHVQLDMDMTVSASQTDTTNEALKAEGSGSAKVGVGPFSVGIQVSASMSVSKESKRQSDYRSHTHATVQMEQAAPPEGLSLIVDALNKNVAYGLEINEAIVKAALPGIAATAATKEIPPPAPPDNGGGGGGSGG